MYLARVLDDIGVRQGVGDAVAAINSTLEKNNSPVLVATIQKAVRMAFPEGFEIDIGNLNQEKFEGQKRASGIKASSTLLYRQQEVLVKRIEEITCFPKVIRFTSNF